MQLRAAPFARAVNTGRDGWQRGNTPVYLSGATRIQIDTSAGALDPIQKESQHHSAPVCPCTAAYGLAPPPRHHIIFLLLVLGVPCRALLAFMFALNSRCCFSPSPAHPPSTPPAVASVAPEPPSPCLLAPLGPPAVIPGNGRAQRSTALFPCPCTTAMTWLDRRNRVGGSCWPPLRTTKG